MRLAPTLLLCCLVAACDSSPASAPDAGAAPPGPDASRGADAGLEGQRDAAAPTDDAALVSPFDASAAGTDASAAPGLDAAPAPLTGVYTVSGTDPLWGAYTGEAEVRPGPDGGLLVAHVQDFSSADFEGDAVSTAWEGWAEPAVDGLRVSVRLARVGFITTYGGLTRSGAGVAPLEVTAVLARSAPDTLQGAFASASPTGTGAESWQWTRAGGPDPIWRNERRLVAGHAPPSAATKSALFATYADYHQLPDLAPYVGREDFQAAVHSFVEDRTDFAYYRANPGRLRVLQKVVDGISLAETRMRNRAFRQKLFEKAAHYDAEVPLHNLDAVGMIVGFVPPDQTISGFSSMLWTGVYAGSQALRHLVTGEAAALDNLRRALHGMFLCVDIVGLPGQFARSVRVHVADGDPTWVQGTGAYAGYDYVPGGNNDMLKGFSVGFGWAHLALKGVAGFDGEKARMAAIVADLTANHPEWHDGNTNEMRGHWLSYFMTGDLMEKVRFEALWPASEPWLVGQGNGALWEDGASDWSGNHLIIQDLLTTWMLSRQTGNHQSDMTAAMAHALTRMRSTDLGLYQLVAASLSGLSPAPPEVEQALWRLREFPAPKESHAIDRRIDPDFSLSPFPSLPWKADWMTNPGRMQGLYAYPFFERGLDVFPFRLNPFAFASGTSPVQEQGGDYLFAYWFGRWAGTIGPGL